MRQSSVVQHGEVRSGFMGHWDVWMGQWDVWDIWDVWMGQWDVFFVRSIFTVLLSYSYVPCVPYVPNVPCNSPAFGILHHRTTGDLPITSKGNGAANTLV